jgi:hypothetical protein
VGTEDGVVAASNFFTEGRHLTAARVGAERANEIARSTPPISEFSNGSANSKTEIATEPTPEGLADTIESTLNSPGEAQAAAQTALHYAAQHLKWEGFVQLVHDIYGAALQCDPTRRGREGSDSAVTFQ